MRYYGKSMLLAIDIGNSSINAGIFSGNKLINKLKIPSYPVNAPDFYMTEIRAFLSKNDVEKPMDGVIISSVVPELTEILHNSAKGLSLREPMILNASLKTGITFDVENPDEIGSDRIANIVAAKEKHGMPALVIDFGTATTISAVRDAKYIGGAILPGIRMMGNVLHKGTSKLPEVDISSLLHQEPHPPAVGKNTKMNMISGIIYGTAGAVERLIREMEKEEGEKFKVIITGGHSDLMALFLKADYRIDPDLTLEGLRIIYEGAISI